MSSASVASAPDRRLLYRTLGWAIFLCVVAIAFRYLVIELQLVAALCEEGGGPWWCAIRESIIRTFYSDAVGIMSLGMGIVALLLGGRASAQQWAIAAIIWAAPSIVIYSADYATPAFLLGLIRLLRG
jgi:hypothetical protein